MTQIEGITYTHADRLSSDGHMLALVRGLDFIARTSIDPEYFIDFTSDQEKDFLHQITGVPNTYLYNHDINEVADPAEIQLPSLKIGDRHDFLSHIDPFILAAVTDDALEDYSHASTNQLVYWYDSKDISRLELAQELVKGFEETDGFPLRLDDFEHSREVTIKAIRSVVSLLADHPDLWDPGERRKPFDQLNKKTQRYITFCVINKLYPPEVV